jgi:hypothetical protein
MAKPFPGLQHRDGGGGVAVMAGPVNSIEPSPSKTCMKNPATKPPILIFLFFHKAIRSELERLHCAAVDFATGDGDINPLLERYRFLRAIYKHHCNAEDEVCFVIISNCFRLAQFFIFILSYYKEYNSTFCVCLFIFVLILVVLVLP